MHESDEKTLNDLLNSPPRDQQFDQRQFHESIAHSLKLYQRIRRELGESPQTRKHPKKKFNIPRILASALFSTLVVATAPIETSEPNVSRLTLSATPGERKLNETCAPLKVNLTVFNDVEPPDTPIDEVLLFARFNDGKSLTRRYSDQWLMEYANRINLEIPNVSQPVRLRALAVSNGNPINVDYEEFRPECTLAPQRFFEKLLGRRLW